MSGPGRLLRSVLGVLVPPTCASCGGGVPAAQAHRLCAACLAEIPPLREPHPGLAGVAQVLCVAEFDGLVQVLVQRFKYAGELSLARPLAELLVEHALSRDLEPDLIVPMPLHPSRQRERGFDQVHLLAGPVAEALSAPRVHPLVRAGARRPQVGLPLDERRDNVAGVFAIEPGAELDGAHVLLIDDVVTTGATVQEAAHTLRRAGVESVDLLAIAHAPKSDLPNLR